MKFLVGILAALLAVPVGCRVSSPGVPAGSDLRSDTTGQDRIDGLGDERGGHSNYPIWVAGSSGNTPYPWLKGLERVMTSVVSLGKGEVLTFTSGDGMASWYVTDPVAPDAYHWIARVRVLDGPISVYAQEISPYPVGASFQFGIWTEWRYYAIQVVEVWLGKPRRTSYQLWDLGGYCPGDFAYCPEGVEIWSAEKCLRIRGEMMPYGGSCEYHHPETGELLVHIGGLDVPSGLVAGEEFIVIGSDAVKGLTERGLWSMLTGIGADPSVSTLTGYQRLIYRTKDDQVDVIFLAGEDFPGSPAGYMGYAGPRWILLRHLARRILDRIVMPYLADHPDDKSYVEAAMSGLLFEEYLFPTPEEPEEPAITSCPEDAVASAGATCEGTFTCHFGKVTCCGEVYSRENCACNRSMSDAKDEFECVVLDEKTCFGGSCPPKSCMADQECPPGMRCFPVILPSPLDAVGYTCVPVP